MKTPEILAIIACLAILVRLGLSASKAIISSKKKSPGNTEGQVEIHLEEDKGVAETNKPKTGEIIHEVFADTPTPLPTVVIAEDNKTIGAGMRKFMGKKYNIISFPSMEKLEDFSKHNAVDLIIIDIQMPSTTGLDFDHIVPVNKEGKYPIIVVPNTNRTIQLMKIWNNLVYPFPSTAPKDLEKKIEEVLSYHLPGTDQKAST